MKLFSFAFRQTVPVLFGYLFLGAAYGILLQDAGFPAIWAFFTSLLIYAGSMQFVLAGFLSGGISILSALVAALSVNCRHIFYGISFIERFRSMGKARPYMIFSLTDETYSLLCGIRIPKGISENRALLLIAALNQSYWVAGSVLGSLLGEVIPFDTVGIDFSMTALFVVIFIEQWIAAKKHLPALTGLACGIFCLLLFGAEQFLLPALILTVTLLMAWRRGANLQEESL